MAHSRKDSDDQFNPSESQQRFEAALRGARIVGHKTHEESRPGKPRTKKVKSPRKRKVVKKPA
jgi:hypothetical protein